MVVAVIVVVVVVVTVVVVGLSFGRPFKTLVAVFSSLLFQSHNSTSF